MIDYKINEWHVATAPKTFHTWEGGGDSITFLTAQRGDEWAASYKYDIARSGTGASGGGSLPSFSKDFNNKQFPSEKEAVLHQLELLFTNPYWGHSKMFWAAMRDYRDTLIYEQLSLF